jgi:hypothetical protein
LYDTFGNDASLLLRHILTTCRQVEFRELSNASIEVDRGIAFLKSSSDIAMIHFLSCKARICIYTSHLAEAGELLSRAEQIRSEVYPVPWQLSQFHKARAEYDLHRLEKRIRNGDDGNLSAYRKQAKKSCRELLKQSRKVAQHRTEAHKMTGVYHWLANRQKKALKWWRKSINEGERLGARLELSRTYFEVGRRLMASQSRHETLDGKTARDHLETARALFAEMGLQRDLDELDRVVSEERIAHRAKSIEHPSSH